MTDNIKTALGSTYRMFYNPAIPASKLTPVQTLDNACHEVNQQIDVSGVNLSTWDAQKQDEIARLVRVNFFYQNLDHEPIRKPILVHKHNDQLLVDCGDTRLMALQLKSFTSTVGVVVTCRDTESDQYSTWQPILCNTDLITATNFDQENAQIFVTVTAPDADYAFEWLEIGDQSTAHHLHNIDHRIQMMQRYLDTQPTDFRFSADWAQEPIDWTAFF
jgi:hypothetical protein